MAGPTSVPIACSGTGRSKGEQVAMLAGALAVPPQYRHVAVWNIADYEYPDKVPGVAVVATDTAVVASTRTD